MGYYTAIKRTETLQQYGLILHIMLVEEAKPQMDISFRIIIYLKLKNR